MSGATILRKRVRRDFVQVPNETIRDSGLSFKAVGVLVHMLSLPDGASISAEKLAEAHSEGRAAILSALKELREAGYYRTVKQRGSDGRMFTVCEVSDTRGRLAEANTEGVPVEAPPESENRTPEPEAENRTSVDPSPKCGYPTFGNRTSKEEDLLEIPTDTPCSPPTGSAVAGIPSSDASASDLDPVEIAFDEWRRITDHPRAVLDSKRRRTIERALAPPRRRGGGLGLTLDEVLDAIRGWRWSSFHRGDNDRGTVYDDLGLILRDRQRAEKFIAYEHGHRDVPASKRAAHERGLRSAAEEFLSGERPKELTRGVS